MNFGALFIASLMHLTGKINGVHVHQCHIQVVKAKILFSHWKLEIFIKKGKNIRLYALSRPLWCTTCPIIHAQLGCYYTFEHQQLLQYHHFLLMGHTLSDTTICIEAQLTSTTYLLQFQVYAAQLQHQSGSFTQAVHLSPLHLCC